VGSRRIGYVIILHLSCFGGERITNTDAPPRACTFRSSSPLAKVGYLLAESYNPSCVAFELYFLRLVDHCLVHVLCINMCVRSFFYTPHKSRLKVITFAILHILVAFVPSLFDEHRRMRNLCYGQPSFNLQKIDIAISIC
jgi:hypothetical protein